ncbi:uncharacterized protein BT62DRAFT_933663 [Guyanagaster necrorhizus]|uniref:Uncharacterized protein n=1 Tax=Guyanagaster necrorhizus TaxID=856835 RepID=A0A9P7VPZ3_9AGAR|nr:uncharacterized protein BT62DRAFT_933663 [Guyanagaster necrorhizus MCA 3950]KAG7444632.1 hypothetical protein BT62DRAFT_933663 [Guyanagaster necrorhizus MCA 3950]
MLAPPITLTVIIILAAVSLLLIITLLALRMRQRRTRLLGWTGENCDLLSEARLDENEARREKELRDEGK